jgi:hypothetical protein
MLVTSLDIRILGKASKKLALRRLVEIHNPYILLIQGTLRDGKKVIDELSKSYKDWEFLDIDVVGKSRGLLTGRRSRSIRLMSCMFLYLGLGTILSVVDLRMDFVVVNVHVPYMDRVHFQEESLSQVFLKNRNPILGGNLNLTVKRAKVWGNFTREDALDDFFIQTFN